jgi:thiol:disulfide interchange protein DsbC
MFKFELKKKIIVATVCLTSLFSMSFVFAENSTQSNSLKNSMAPSTSASFSEGFDEKAFKSKFLNTLGLKVDLIAPTPFKGVVLIVTNQGQFYASEDAEFFIQGRVFQLGDKLINVADASLAGKRLEGVAKFSNDTITYPAKDEKYVVTVFTDITCGFCRKLHNQMADYNAMGITVKYLPYPRSGIYDQSGGLTKGYQDLRSIWCNEDPNTALTKAKTGTGVAHRICDKPVAEAFNFGRQIGVNGTPAIILSDGSMLAGYKEPKDLLEALKNL